VASTASGSLRPPVRNKWGPGVYVTGDGAKRDAGNCLWLLGRVDDVISVAGHRIGTMEVERARRSPGVAEAAVVGRAHEIKGQAIAAFVTSGRPAVRQAARRRAEPRREEDRRDCAADDVLFTADLPKTRSGKIMRRLLRDIAEGKRSNTTTLAIREWSRD
jgi:acetyl-CoA synthetase